MCFDIVILFKQHVSNCAIVSFIYFCVTSSGSSANVADSVTAVINTFMSADFVAYLLYCRYVKECR